MDSLEKVLKDLLKYADEGLSIDETMADRIRGFLKTLQTDIKTSKNSIANINKHLNHLEINFKQLQNENRRYEQQFKDDTTTIQTEFTENENMRLIILDYYNHCKNDKQICGINTRAEQALNRSEFKSRKLKNE